MTLFASFICIALNSLMPFDVTRNEKTSHTVTSHMVYPYKIHGGCSVGVPTVDFCDEDIIREIEVAFQTLPVTFNKKYIVYGLKRTINLEPALAFVVIDQATGAAYPLPFEFAYPADEAEGDRTDDVLRFSVDNDKICTKTAVWTYKSTMDAPLCWTFDGTSFKGDWTPLMDGFGNDGAGARQ